MTTKPRSEEEAMKMSNDIGDSQSTREACEGCGTPLAPGARYCVSCYRPVTRTTPKAQDFTERLAKDDSTIVFVPEEREARLRRNRLRRRFILAGFLIVAVVGASIVVWHFNERNRLAKGRVMAREQMALREIALFADALERFKIDVGRYPTTEEGVSSLMVKPATARFEVNTGLAFWSGPYLDGYYELDPWGNEYLYRSSNDNQAYQLFSNGPDGDEAAPKRLRANSPN